MKNKLMSVLLVVTMVRAIFVVGGCEKARTVYYQCLSEQDAAEGVKVYVVTIPEEGSLTNPGLVFLARGLDEKEGYVLVNGNRYDLPALPGSAPQEKEVTTQQSGKEGWYTSNGSDELLGKIVLPLSLEHIHDGVNRIVFHKTTDADGFRVTDARITSVTVQEAKVAQLTYRAVTRGGSPRIDDFDYVVNYKGEGRRKESDLPEWAQRGKVRYYRAGIDFDHLDRMFEMFIEGNFNLVMLQVATPEDTSSEEFKRYTTFIDRCHANGIRVTFDGGAGRQPIRLNSISADSVEANPEMNAWISRDEYGNPRQRRRGSSYWPDLTNKDYRNRVLKTADIAIDAGVDELYYDWAIGGTKGIVQFFKDTQDIIDKRGMNITVFGNCKGNIIADGICDIGKSEGTEEAGVWDERWVHNVVQARFYYAAGDGWKPYRSKYEGADPGVPNPGAYNVVDGMKIGWKRPMAEAKAFQSDFVIAEAGRNLFNGWVMKNNATAMKVWDDICQYNKFFDEHEELFTDVTTVSKIGLLALPVIPSFEVSVKRVQLYHALAEMNVMYDVLLLPRITEKMLSKYEAIIIPDIPWIADKELDVIRKHIAAGGKVYTLGSCEKLRELASIYSPAYVCHNTHENVLRMEFLANLRQLCPQPIIEVHNAEYVIANVIKKDDSDRIFVHLVNYSKPVNNVRVTLHLEDIVKETNASKIQLYSPDSALNEVKKISVHENQIELTIPYLEIYDIITIN